MIEQHHSVGSYNLLFTEKYWLIFVLFSVIVCDNSFSLEDTSTSNGYSLEDFSFNMNHSFLKKLQFLLLWKVFSSLVIFSFLNLLHLRSSTCEKSISTSNRKSSNSWMKINFFCNCDIENFLLKTKVSILYFLTNTWNEYQYQVTQ